MTELRETRMLELVGARRIFCRDQQFDEYSFPEKATAERRSETAEA